MSAHSSFEMASHYHSGDNYASHTGSKINKSSSEYLIIPSSTDGLNGKNNNSYVSGGCPSEESQGCSSYYIQTSEGHHLSATLLDARTRKHRKRSRKCCIKIYTWLVSLTVATFVAVILIGLTIVKPYIKVHGFIMSYCSVKEAFYYDIPTVCWCGKGCKSNHPCLKLKVLPKLETEDFISRNATKLSENEINRGKVSMFIYALYI